MQLASTTIAEICHGRTVVAARDTALATGLTWDSRDVEPGNVYAALPGERVDGHDFCCDALRAGAAGVLVSKASTEELISCAEERDAFVIEVDDTMQAIVDLARAWRSMLSATVVALTGSSGKTTTKNYIFGVLSTMGSCVATLGNQNNELGVPATLLRAEKSTETVVVEMGMRGRGQIAELCDIAQPNQSLITNVGTSHIELLGSRDAIAQAKAEIIAGTKTGGVVYINSSDDYASQLPALGDAAAHNLTVTFFDGSGSDPETYDEAIRPTVYATNIQLDEWGCATFDLHIPGQVASCSLQVAGRVNVHNACAAAAVGANLGMSAQEITQALATVEPEQGRQRILKTEDDVIVVDDCYNANPDSTCASLETFATLLTAGKRIAVLGDMLELGDFTQAGHARVGAAAAASNLDALVCVGTFADDIAQAAREAGQAEQTITCVASADEALAQVHSMLAPGDAVLIKASHSVGLARVVEGLVTEA